MSIVRISESGEPTALAQLIRLMLAAGGPRNWLASVPWPLHRTLVEERAELVKLAALGCRVSLSANPDPDCGWRVDGVDGALVELQRVGILGYLDEGFFACYEVDETWLRECRLDLMRLPANEASVIYRAARRWDALAATSLKNWRTAALSSAPTVRSVIPIRRHSAVPAFR